MSGNTLLRDYNITAIRNIGSRAFSFIIKLTFSYA